MLYAIPIAFGVSVVCFSLVYLAPGDPLQTILPSDASAETIAMVKAAYGFDQPLPIQFLKWLGHVLTGDFGESIATRRPVLLEVSGAMSNTITLVMFAVPLSFSVGYVMGAVAGCFPGSMLDRLITGTAVMGVSVPNYWFGIVLVIIFAVEMMALPATGMGANGSVRFQHLPLGRPALPGAAGDHPVDGADRHHLAHHAGGGGRGAEPGFRHHAARQGTFSEFAVIRHVLKNALPQVLAVMGLQFGYLIGGSILVETVFTWPGSGFLLSKAIINRDVPVLQGTILALSMVFVATNLLVDLLQSMIDPRIRRA